jgi:hypothetical protein
MEYQESSDKRFRHPTREEEAATVVADGHTPDCGLVLVLAWPVVLQTWADERGPCSLKGAREGSSVESRGWSWSSFSYSCVVETPSGQLRAVEVRWFS